MIMPIPRRVLFALFSMLLLLPGCVPEPLEPDPIGPTDGWCIFHPLPGGYDLNAVWGDTPTDVWAVGDHGVIVHSDGASLRRVDSPTSHTLETLGGWSASDVYAGGDNALFHFDGHVWDVDTRFPDKTILDLLCAPDGRLYIAGSMGVRYRDGSDWHQLAGPTDSSVVVWLGPDDRVRVGDESQIWIVENGLASVEQVFPGESVRFGDGGLVAVEQDDGIVDRILGYSPGDGWTEQLDTHTSMRALLDMDGVVRSFNGGIYLDGDLIWSNSSGRWIYGLASCDGGILACGYGGTLMYGKSGADGFTWQETAEGLGFRHFNDFSGTGCDDIWAAEWWGRVLHFDGEVWARENTPLPANHSVSRIQVFGDGWVAARGGGKLSLRDPDGHWMWMDQPEADINRFHAIAPDSIFVACASEYLFWDGTVWTSVGIAPGSVRSITATPSGLLYALVTGIPSTLQIWSGTAFTTVLELPGFAARRMSTSRSDETLWLGGYATGSVNRSIIYRYDDGELVDMSAGGEVPKYFTDMTILRPDDVFVLASDRVWRLYDGVWTQEFGLPEGESYYAIWSHPDCGVFVEGYPLFFKEY